MGPSPYRVPASLAETAGSIGPSSDAGLFTVFTVMWVASVIRVLVAVLHREALGQEPVVAILVLVLVPLLARDSLASMLREKIRIPGPDDRAPGCSST